MKDYVVIRLEEAVADIQRVAQALRLSVQELQLAPCDTEGHLRVKFVRLGPSTEKDVAGQMEQWSGLTETVPYWKPPTSPNMPPTTVTIDGHSNPTT